MLIDSTFLPFPRRQFFHRDSTIPCKLRKLLELFTFIEWTAAPRMQYYQADVLMYVADDFFRRYLTRVAFGCDREGFATTGEYSWVRYFIILVAIWFIFQHELVSPLIILLRSYGGDIHATFFLQNKQHTERKASNSATPLSPTPTRQLIPASPNISSQPRFRQVAASPPATQDKTASTVRIK